MSASMAFIFVFGLLVSGMFLGGVVLTAREFREIERDPARGKQRILPGVLPQRGR